MDAIVGGGGRAVAIQADVSTGADVERLFETAERELGPIKALVNNAGDNGRLRARRGREGLERPSEMFSRSTSWDDVVLTRGGAAHVDAAGRNGWSDREHFFARGAQRIGWRMGALRGF